MSYPEHGAGYRNRPKFLDRAIAAERRAEGGSVPGDEIKSMVEGGGQPLYEHNRHLEPVPMPTIRGEDTGDHMDADVSMNLPSAMRRLKPMASGGQVPSDPDEDSYDTTHSRSGPAYTPGSQGALREAMEYSRAEQSLDQPNRNRGQGPTRRRANQNEGD